MPPIILHRSKEYSKDLQVKTLLEWTVYHIPSGYMYRNGRLKAMTQFSNVFGASPVNNQMIFFGGHGSHFDDHSLRQMKCQNINPFYWKHANQPTTRPLIMYQIKNWSLSTINWRMCVFWSMVQQSFYLVTWTPYWWNHGTPSRCQLEILSVTNLLKQSYSPSNHPN